MATINQDRVDDFLNKKKKELREQVEWINNKIAIIRSCSDAIDDAVKSAGGRRLIIGNMYSTGNLHGPEYTGTCKMTSHCTAEVGEKTERQVENIRKKLATLNSLPQLSLAYVKVDAEGILHFQIWF